MKTRTLTFVLATLVLVAGTIACDRMTRSAKVDVDLPLPEREALLRVGLDEEGHPVIDRSFHERTDVYTGEVLNWRCLECPEGAEFKIDGIRRLDVDLAVDLVLELAASEPELLEELCARDNEVFRQACSGDGLFGNLFGGDETERFFRGAAPEWTPAGTAIESTAIDTKDLGPSGNLAVKFNWSVRMSAEQEPVVWDPHIYIHMKPPPGYTTPPDG